MKKPVYAALAAGLCLMLAGGAVFVHSEASRSEKTVMAEIEKNKEENEQYMSGLRASIQSDIYAELDGYLSGYLTKTNLLQFFTEEDILNVAGRAAEEAEAILKRSAAFHGEAAGLSEEERAQISAMIAEAIRSIPQGAYHVSAVARLTEEEKAALSEAIADHVLSQLDQIAVQKEMTEEETAILCAEIRSIIWEDLQAGIAEILSKQEEASLDIHYALTEDDKAGILESISSSIDLSGYAACACLDSDAFHKQVSSFVAEEMSWLLEADMDQYIPVKGVDYFTDADIGELSAAVLSGLKKNYDIVISDLEGGVEALDSRQEEMAAALEEFERELEEKESQLADLKASFSEADSGVSESIGSINSEISAIQKNIGTIKSTMEELECSYVTIEQFNFQAASMEGVIGSMQEADAFLSGKIDDAAGQNAAAISGLQAQINDAAGQRETAISGLQEQLDDAASQTASAITGLQIKLDDAAGQNAAAISGLQTQIDDAAGQNAAAISGLQAQINDAASQRETAISGLQEQLDDAASQTASAITGLQIKLDDAAGQNAAVISGLQTQIDDAAGQNAAAISGLQAQINDAAGQRETAISGLQTQIDNISSSLQSHTHDGRYYTESEVDNLLKGKSDTTHTHDGRYYTESEVDNLLKGKSDTTHTHDERYYTESEVNNLLKEKNNVTFELKSGTVTLSGGLGYYRHDAISANQFIIPLSAYMEGDATKTCDIQVQSKIHFRFFTPSTNTVIQNGTYQFEYLLVTVS